MALQSRYVTGSIVRTAGTLQESNRGQRVLSVGLLVLSVDGRSISIPRVDVLEAWRVGSAGTSSKKKKTVL